MPVLTVANGHTANLYRLGQNVPFSQLSEKRITKRVREELRGAYGVQNVHVSCSASYINNTWQGECIIHGIRYKYTIR
jgi:hypothetical protein